MVLKPKCLREFVSGNFSVKFPLTKLMSSIFFLWIYMLLHMRIFSLGEPWKKLSSSPYLWSNSSFMVLKPKHLSEFVSEKFSIKFPLTKLMSFELFSFGLMCYHMWEYFHLENFGKLWKIVIFSVSLEQLEFYGFKAKTSSRWSWKLNFSITFPFGFKSSLAQRNVFIENHFQKRRLVYASKTGLLTCISQNSKKNSFLWVSARDNTAPLCAEYHSYLSLDICRLIEVTIFGHILTDPVLVAFDAFRHFLAFAEKLRRSPRPLLDRAAITSARGELRRDRPLDQSTLKRTHRRYCHRRRPLTSPSVDTLTQMRPCN